MVIGEPLSGELPAVDPICRALVAPRALRACRRNKRCVVPFAVLDGIQWGARAWWLVRQRISLRPVMLRRSMMTP